MNILDTLERAYQEREEEVERFLASIRAEAAPYLTTSVDLRHSGLRCAPVDTNLYPAGFNNLSASAEARAAASVRHYLDLHLPQAEKALIVPETHTRNLAYLDSLFILRRVLEAAGLQVEIGSLTAGEEAVTLISRSGWEIRQEPLRRAGDALETRGGFKPDFILLNNDCSSGVPEILQGIRRPILPPPQMGWHARKKSVHFAAYQALAKKFSEIFGLDPWLISADFLHCGPIDFKQKSGLDCLADAIDELIARTRAKYAEYGIKEEPYVFIKADSGTYGMGIMTARSGDEVRDINKKERNKMHVIKEGVQVSEVMIQEGVPTVDVVEEKPAEPLLYLIDGVPVGGMYRINSQRDRFGNLNAAGMEFADMCGEEEALSDCRHPVEECQFRAFGLIAVLAALAAGRERY